MYVTLENLSKSFGDAVVLHDVTLEFNEGAKVGLVGANGVGKSTLLEIIAGRVPPDAGHIRYAPGLELGYLRQTTQCAAGMTVEGLLDHAMGSLNAIEIRLRECEAILAADADDANTLAEYGRLLERYERRGGYTRTHRMEEVMAGLGVSYLDRSEQLTWLSGGEQARVGLAALLVQQPDLILLDEPTNHLDFGAAEWLEDYLTSFSGGALIVSHDREFLNHAVQSILEIDEHSHVLKRYAGGYDSFAAQKIQERARWDDDYQRQQEEIHELRQMIKSSARQVAHNRAPKDNDKFLKAFKAGRLEGVISRNVRSADEKLRRIEADPIPRPPRPLRFDADFDPSDLVSHAPLTVSGVYKRYGTRQALRDVSLSVGNDTRAVIVGPNGAGKSTLLKIIAGLELADAGDVSIAGSVVLGYLDQQQETLPRGASVYEAYRGDRVGDWEEIKAELLSYGIFEYGDLHKSVDVLSVGQKRKLQIARLMAMRANLLLLDEPTNHISLDALEQLEAALLAFPGPVIAVSHDRRFLDKFANEIWEMRDGVLHRHLGAWAEYRTMHGDVAASL